MAEGPRLDIPVVLVVLAFFLITAFQTEQLVRERTALQQLQVAQETNLTEAQKIRMKFEMLAGETEKLAQAGDPGAKAVMTSLQARGVTVHAASAPAAAQP